MNRTINILMILMVVHLCNSQNANTGNQNAVDHAIDEFTGTTGYTISLGAVSSGNIGAGLSLVYNSSGCRPSETTTPAGEGWSLGIGLSLAREVQGLPDESPTGTFYGYPNYTQCTTNCNNSAGVLNGSIDAEPDIFSYTIPCYSGKFYIDGFQNIYPINISEVAISRIGGAHPFQEFILTSPDGISYKFIIGEVPFPAPNSGNNIVVNWIPSSIISYDKTDTIDFTYEFYKVGRKRFTYEVTNFPTVPNQQVVHENYNVPYLTMIHGDYAKIVLHHQSSGIEATNGLSPISYSRKYTQAQFFHGDICKAWDFTYKNLYDNGTLSGIRLMSAAEKSCDASVIIPPYSFTYYEPIADHRPSPVTSSIDHWGYYNNAGNNSLFPPTCSGSTCIGTANRQPNETFTKNGMLHTITNPLGLLQSMEYELNSYKVVPYSGAVNLLELDACPDYPDGNFTGCANSTVTSSAISFTPFQIANGYIDLCLKPDVTSSTPAYAYEINLDIKDINGIVLNTYSFNLTNLQEQCQLLYLKDLTLPNDQPLITSSASYIFTLTASQGKSRAIIKSPQETIEQSCGGLRLKKITKSEGNATNDIVTNITYQDGVLYKQPKYLFLLPVVNKVSNIGFGSITGTHGYHIGYGKVTITGNKPGSMVKYYKTQSSTNPGFDP
jgi:hypothetical protein